MDFRIIKYVGLGDVEGGWRVIGFSRRRRGFIFYRVRLFWRVLVRRRGSSGFRGRVWVWGGLDFFFLGRGRLVLGRWVFIFSFLLLFLGCGYIISISMDVFVFDMA